MQYLCVMILAWTMIITGERCCQKVCTPIVDGECSGPIEIPVGMVYPDGTKVADLTELANEQKQLIQEIKDIMKQIPKLERRPLPHYMESYVSPINNQTFFWPPIATYTSYRIDFDRANTFCHAFGGQLLAQGWRNKLVRQDLLDHLIKIQPIRNNVGVYPWVGLAALDTTGTSFVYSDLVVVQEDEPNMGWRTAVGPDPDFGRKNSDPEWPALGIYFNLQTLYRLRRDRMESPICEFPN